MFPVFEEEVGALHDLAILEVNDPGKDGFTYFGVFPENAFFFGNVSERAHLSTVATRS